MSLRNADYANANRGLIQVEEQDVLLPSIPKCREVNKGAELLLDILFLSIDSLLSALSTSFCSEEDLFAKELAWTRKS